jgi:hypothetical protein
LKDAARELLSKGVGGSVSLLSLTRAVERADAQRFSFFAETALGKAPSVVAEGGERSREVTRCHGGSRSLQQAELERGIFAVDMVTVDVDVDAGVGALLLRRWRGRRGRFRF